MFMDQFSQEVRREQLGEGTHDIITPNLTCHPYKTTQACVPPTRHRVSPS